MQSGGGFMIIQTTRERLDLRNIPDEQVYQPGVKVFARVLPEEVDRFHIGPTLFVRAARDECIEHIANRNNATLNRDVFT